MKDVIKVQSMQVEVDERAFMNLECMPKCRITIHGLPNRPMSHKEVEEYVRHRMFRLSSSREIKKVIFNPPATIVLWEDGEKTVVKTHNGETYDPEKGLAMAIAKKALGNEGNYFNQIKPWVDKYYEKQTDVQQFEITIPASSEGVQQFIDSMRRPGTLSVCFDGVKINKIEDLK